MQIPSALQPSTYQLAAVSTFQQGSSVQETTAGTTDLTVPYHSLADAFDNTGITSNSNTNPYPGFLGFDGIGTTYSAEGLAAAGLTPGTTMNANGMQFVWPNVAPAMPNNVLADGQAFQLSGHGSQIGFLAASNNSPLSGAGTVYYTDGTSSTFTLAVGNFWYPLGSNGNSTTTQVAAVNYANYPTGSSGHTVYVFSVSVSIDPSKTVKAVVLPKITGSVAGYVAAMHVFGIAIK